LLSRRGAGCDVRRRRLCRGADRPGARGRKPGDGAGVAGPSCLSGEIPGRPRDQNRTVGRTRSENGRSRKKRFHGPLPSILPEGEGAWRSPPAGGLTDFDNSGNIRKPPGCEPFKVYRTGGNYRMNTSNHTPSLAPALLTPMRNTPPDLRSHHPRHYHPISIIEYSANIPGCATNL